MTREDERRRDERRRRRKDTPFDDYDIYITPRRRRRRRRKAREEERGCVIIVVRFECCLCVVCEDQTDTSVSPSSSSLLSKKELTKYQRTSDARTFEILANQKTVPPPKIFSAIAERKETREEMMTLLPSFKISNKVSR